MSFIWPAALVGLLLVPLAAAAYVVVGRRPTSSPQRATLGAGYGDVTALGWKRHLSPALGLLALCALLLGLARPQATVEVPELRSTVMLVFDTSQSMVADDLEPTRLDAAKAAATSFVEDQPDSVEIGIVSFGSSGAITLRPSDDRTAVLSSIDRLQAAGGTSLNEGLFAGLSAIAESPIIYLPDEAGDVNIPPVDFGGFGSAIIVLFSDGEDTTEQSPAPLAELAASNGIRIYPVGLGSTDGTVIELDGFSLSTALNEASLQELAERSNGTYFQVETVDELAAVTDTIDQDLQLNEEQLELTSVFGVGALSLIALAALASMRLKGRML